MAAQQMDWLRPDHRGLGAAGRLRLLVARNDGGPVHRHVGAGEQHGQREHGPEEDIGRVINERGEEIEGGAGEQQEDEHDAGLAVGVHQEADDRLEGPGQVGAGEELLGDGLAEAVVGAEVLEEGLVGDALEGIGQALQHVLHGKEHLQRVPAEDGAAGGGGRRGFFHGPTHSGGRAR
jgi:hypothetical protein